MITILVIKIIHVFDGDDCVKCFFILEKIMYYNTLHIKKNVFLFILIKY